MTLFVIMGSGETAPVMVRAHRDVFARTGPGPCLLLDTPFGFQGNADVLTSRTVGYFRDSVGREVGVARWRRADAPLVEREAALAQLEAARWAFAGPGSPSYALRQWIGTPVPSALADVVERGGTLVLGSAAAVTGGTHAIPVYEIYKVGSEPQWLEGLDLLGRLTGLRAAVVPHYDNAEGGTHDTRFCYLGEERLALLERRLPDDVGVLGVDEHTALVLDLQARHAEVTGNGGVTIRRRGSSLTFPAGTTVAIDDVDALLRGTAQHAGRFAVPDRRPDADSTSAPSPFPPEHHTASVVPESSEPLSLSAAAEAAKGRFDAAASARDVDGCVEAVLALEQALEDWQADTLQSDDRDRARRTLRALVVRLGEVARVGARDPRDVVGPYVDLLLDLRARARAGKDYATSDLVRDRLGEVGVEVRDTSSGMEWLFHD